MGSSGPSNTMRGRVAGSGIRLWILMKLNRWVMTAVVLAIVFVALVAASRLGLTPLRTIIENHDGLEFLFSAFIGAIITGTSIVVTINQLVLSQELGAIGDQRERMQESMGFRRDVEEALETGTSPPEPAAFLYELVGGIQERGNELLNVVEDEGDEALLEDVESYVDSLTEGAQQVKDDLEDAQFGEFEVIWTALNFNYSWKIYSTRRIQSEQDDLSEELEVAFENLIDALSFFGPAREHFKTLYFQWEFINLSRALLYTAIPALAVMGGMIMYVDDTALMGVTLGVDNLVWLTSAGFVIGITPFVIFTAYVLRIVTVTKRTLAMGPFILRETERDE